MRDAAREPSQRFATDHAVLRPKLDELVEAYRNLHLAELEAGQPWATEAIYAILRGAQRALELGDMGALADMAEAPKQFITAHATKGEVLAWQLTRAASIEALITSLEEQLEQVDATMSEDRYKEIPAVERSRMPLGVLRDFDVDLASEVVVRIVETTLLATPERAHGLANAIAVPLPDSVIVMIAAETGKLPEDHDIPEHEVGAIMARAMPYREVREHLRAVAHDVLQRSIHQGDSTSRERARKLVFELLDALGHPEVKAIRSAADKATARRSRKKAREKRPPVPSDVPK